MTEAMAEAVDIAIVGGGPVGLALACALAETRWRIALVEHRPRGAWADDPRALAIAHGGRQILERLQAWDATAATAIREIHVSQRGGFGRTLMHADDYRLPALGYVTPYRALTAALDRANENAGHRTPWLDECTVERIDGGPGDACLRLTLAQHGTERQIDARLVVHAEGAPVDATRGVFARDYRQHAIIAEAIPAQGHRHRAWERFTPDGPIALLPLGEAYSLVMTTPSAQTEQWLQLGDTEFLAALRERFGQRLDLVSIGARAAFPLALRIRTSPIGDRQVWIGNSAQTLHPVSGQGFNLGLRDAWELAETLIAHHEDNDPGCAKALSGYARRRRLDRLTGAAFTDGIVRLFSNAVPPLALARGLGLLALDIAPPLRHALARRMIWGARAWP